MLPGLLFLVFCAAASADDSQRLLRIDHFVPGASTAPSMSGRASQIYVREVVKAGLALRGEAKEIVVFVHGAGTPAEVAFDVPYADYSWMAFLAQAGFDTFSMDMTGYGRSTRPEVMNDPATATKTDAVVTTMESDWADLDRVVEYVRKLRGAAKVHLVGWSLGGPRAGGYAGRHPEKVGRLALLAPAYRSAASTQSRPAQPGMNLQSRADFDANWDRQLGCPDQFEMAARETVWKEMLASDPVGATWRTGVRRAPNVAFRGDGWNAEAVARMQTPALLLAAVHDAQAPIDNIRRLHADYGAAEKVFAEIPCTSHNALWEKNHLMLFRASLEWFTKGTVNGKASGPVRLGN